METPKPSSCFLHVEKSGGSSLIEYLRTTLGADRVYHANNSRYQHAPLDLLLSRYPVVAGHFTFASMSDSLLAGTFLFTFLREPVDRVLSLYYFWRQVEGHEREPGPALAKAHQLAELLEILPGPGRPSSWSNWQTYLFSGAPDCERSAEELLPAALRNLERCDFVGLHQQFDAGVARLCALRGWAAPASASRRVNVTPSRPPLAGTSATVLERLRALNACDLQLYARAEELWESSLRQARAGAVVVVAAPVANEPAAPPPAPEAAGPMAPPAGPNARREQGSREIVLTAVRVRGALATSGEGVVQQYDRASIELHGSSTVDAAGLTVGIRLTDDFGAEVYGTNTLLLGRELTVAAGHDFRLDYTFEMILAPGTYHVTAAIHAADDHRHKCYHWVDNAVAFECRSVRAATFAGVADLKATVTFA